MANVSKKIPSNTQPTWTADINGKRYEYLSGITEAVPEEVAALIDGVENSEGKPDPRASQRGIEKDVTQIVKDNFTGGVGYEETTEVVMLPETSFEVSESAPQAVLSNSFPYTFEIGKEYTVTLDGVANTYTVVDKGDGSGIIFSSSFEDFEKGNGWACLAQNSVCVILTGDIRYFGTHTITISGEGVTINKIDDKYLGEIPFKMDKTNPVGEGSFSLNRKEGTDIGGHSFAEGYETTASGSCSHAEGYATTVSGNYSHAEGYATTVSGNNSHAEGDSTTASGNYSHAEGSDSIASGDYSHAEGLGTIAASNQHVQGKYNVKDADGVYAHIIGGGLYNHRKNIHTVDWNGNAWYAGNVEGKALIIASSTAGSTKRFKVTVDDAGTLTATEVTS